MIDVLELLNEGAGFRGDDWAQGIRSFFNDGYYAVREAGPEGMKVMIGDAFLGVSVRFDAPLRGYMAESFSHRTGMAFYPRETAC